MESFQHNTETEVKVAELSPIEMDEFAAEFRRCIGAVEFTAVRRGYPAADAPDLGQKVYLKASRGAAKFKDRGNGIMPWLHTIANNIIYDEKSAASRQPYATKNFDFHDPDTGNEQDPNWQIARNYAVPSAEDQTLAEEDEDAQLQGRENPKYQALYAAIDKLPEKQCSAMLAVSLGELSVEEYAVEAGVHRRSVIALLNRGQKRLGELLTDNYTESVTE